MRNAHILCVFRVQHQGIFSPFSKSVVDGWTKVHQPWKPKVWAKLMPLAFTSRLQTVKRKERATSVQLRQWSRCVLLDFLHCRLHILNNEQYLDLVLKPYYRKVLDEHPHLPSDQRMVLLLDCYKVHISADFLKYLQTAHLYIQPVFVLAGCKLLSFALLSSHFLKSISHLL